MKLKEIIDSHRLNRRIDEKAFKEVLNLITERTALFNLGLSSDESHVTTMRLETVVEFDELDGEENFQDWLLDFEGMNLIKDVDSALIRLLLPVPQKIFYKEYLNDSGTEIDFSKVKTISGVEAELLLIPWNLSPQNQTKKKLVRSYSLRENEIIGVNDLKGTVLYKLEMTLSEVAGKFKLLVGLKLNVDHIKQSGSFLIARDPSKENKKRTESNTLE